MSRETTRIVVAARQWTIEARRTILIVATTSFLLSLGCCTTHHQAIPPANAADALRQINENLELTEPLYCNGLVTFHFRDEDRNPHSFIAHPTVLIFRPPQCLYFDIKNTLGGSVARVGSNDERYWMWVDIPDIRKLIWGTWAHIGDLPPGRVTFPPNDLLDALCLRPLPTGLSGGAPAALRVDGADAADQRLIFLAGDGQGGKARLREIILDPAPPHLPSRIVDRGPDGRIVMDAQIGNWTPIDDHHPNGPRTPRRYVVNWPLSDAQMRLDIDRVRLPADLKPFCEFPQTWNGEVEALDQPARPPTLQPSKGAQ